MLPVVQEPELDTDQASRVHSQSQTLGRCRALNDIWCSSKLLIKGVSGSNDRILPSERTLSRDLWAFLLKLKLKLTSVPTDN